ncbi:hypothetical protein C8J57DRAFT_1314989 [Mycena rebaudengoi]|nr:hypothetical protein C8J57DRAFT_1314989 [Mycena rebaudengoi]
MSSVAQETNLHTDQPTFAHPPVHNQGPLVHGDEIAGSAPIKQATDSPPIVPFKDQVIGVAKKTRGTLLGKPELKEHGEKILQGEATIYDKPPFHDEPASSV